MAKFDEFGMQIPDETPVEIPVHIKRLNRSFSTDEVRNIVRGELSRQARENGFDSIADADDFNVDDDSPDFLSAFEMREEFEDRGHVIVQKETPSASEAESAGLVPAKTAVKVVADKAAPAAPAGASS